MGEEILQLAAEKLLLEEIFRRVKAKQMVWPKVFSSVGLNKSHTNLASFVICDCGKCTAVGLMPNYARVMQCYECDPRCITLDWVHVDLLNKSTFAVVNNWGRAHGAKGCTSSRDNVYKGKGYAEIPKGIWPLMRHNNRSMDDGTDYPHFDYVRVPSATRGRTICVGCGSVQEHIGGLEVFYFLYCRRCNPSRYANEARENTPPCVVFNIGTQVRR